MTLRTFTDRRRLRDGIRNADLDYNFQFVLDSAGGNAAWGGITGTLADQTDLQTVLDAKVPLAGDVTITGLKTFDDFTRFNGSVDVAGHVSAVTSPPTAAAHLTRKDYVDGEITALDGVYVKKIGDIMTGSLVNTGQQVTGYDATGWVGTGLETGYTTGYGWVQAYDRTLAEYRPIQVNGSAAVMQAVGGVGSVELISSGTAGVLLKPGSYGVAATGAIEASQRVRAAGDSVGDGWAGEGLELSITGNTAYVTGFDRTTSLYIPTQMWGSDVAVSAITGDLDIAATSGLVTLTGSASEGVVSATTFKGNQRVRAEGTAAATAGWAGVGVELAVDSNVGYVASYNRSAMQNESLVMLGSWTNMTATVGDVSFTTGGSDRMTVKSTGRVGIGTTNPDSKLLVVDNLSTASCRIGFNGVSANYFDADTHYFRRGSDVAAQLTLASAGSVMYTPFTANQGLVIPGGQKIAYGDYSSVTGAVPTHINLHSAAYGFSVDNSGSLVHHTGINHIFRSGASTIMNITPHGVGVGASAVPDSTFGFVTSGKRSIFQAQDQYSIRVAHPTAGGAYVGCHAADSLAFSTNAGTHMMQVNPNGVVWYNGLASYQNVGGGAGIHSIFYHDNVNVGSITTNVNSTAFNESSDYRLKENVQPYDVDALAILRRNPTKRWDWKTNGEEGIGWIAHEVQVDLPHIITGEKDAKEMQHIDKSKMVPVLWRQNEQQQDLIDELRAEIDALKKLITAS